MADGISSTVYSKNRPLKHLNRIVKRSALDIEFQDLKYSVRDDNFKGGWNQILHSINGTFRCGELTAILGPSGAGKTTLLNVLAGYVRSEVQGSIKINNLPRDLVTFNKLSSYIMGDNLVQPYLTVKEAMTYAAGFKLGTYIKYHDKVSVVEEIIDLLGLEKCVDTYSEHLSGGERKRFTIALELINNPPIIFLDEPTTGMDNSSVKQCINLLKKISKLKRTVVCTIHQPPASLFQVFDQIYVMANGLCVYNGSPTQLVPFLSAAGYSCPPNYTPADYVIELIHSESSIVNTLKEAIENGKLNVKEISDEENSLETFHGEESCSDENKVTIQKSDLDFSSPFHVQFFLLLSRMMLQMKRNRIILYIQFFYHLLSGLVIAGIFTKIGNDATQIMVLLKYCICCVVFFSYTYTMIPILLFPLEVRVLQREHFNRWYGLKAYYAALTVSTLPLLIILVTMFSSLAYFLTDQPNEADRFIGFCVILVTIAYTSQALGYLIGSIFVITKGSIVGSAVLIPLIMISLHGLDYNSKIGPFYSFLMTLSFIRNGIVGLCNILSYKRGPLECKESFCIYVQMDNFMKHLSIPVTDYRYQFGIILIFMIVFRIMGYLSLKCRLNIELVTKLRYYVKKIRIFK